MSYDNALYKSILHYITATKPGAAAHKMAQNKAWPTFTFSIQSIS